MISRRGPNWWANAVRRAATILVIDVGGTVAGYATLGRNRSRDLTEEGEIYELYIKPEFQGIGLGSRLFRAARQRLKAHGFRGLVVWALEENENALTFYQGAGGRDIAEGVEVFDHKALRKIAFIWD
jgi:ribosomal protein S18 acetylase RimI-like enzyme